MLSCGGEMSRFGAALFPVAQRPEWDAVARASSSCVRPSTRRDVLTRWTTHSAGAEANRGRPCSANPPGTPAQSARRAWNWSRSSRRTGRNAGSCAGLPPSCSPSATGSPSSSDVDLFSSAWLFGDGLARTPPMRRSQSPPTSRAGAMCVGWAQLTMYKEGVPSIAASTASTASRNSEPSGSLPSVSTVKETTQGIPARAAARAIPSPRPYASWFAP